MALTKEEMEFFVEQFGSIEERFIELDKKIGNVKSELNEKIDQVKYDLQQDIYGINKRLSDRDLEFNTADGIDLLKIVDKHDRRITRLEKKLAH